MYTYLLDFDRALGEAHTLFLLTTSSSCGKTGNSSGDLLTVRDIQR